MPNYLIVMLALTAGLLLAGGLLYAGQTGWLHSFDRARVKDRKAYARFLGKAVASLGISTSASGLTYLAAGAAPAVVLLLTGFVATMVAVAKAAGRHY